MAKKKVTKGTRAKQKSRAESVTGNKAGEIETRQVGADLKIANGEKIVHYLKAVKGTKERIGTIQGQLRNIYKQAKADNVPKAVIDELLSLERGDPLIFRAEMETLANGLKAVGAPFQLNVFDTAYANDVEQAKAEATQAAKAGRGPECRFSENSAAYDAYMETYSLVQAGNVPGAETLSDEEKLAAIKAGRSEGAELAH